MKQSKENNKKVTYWVIAAIAFVYAVMAFVSWELNPSQWSDFARFMFVGLEIFGALSAARLAVEYYTE